MPAGIIRGALARLGYVGTVVPEITSMPQCMFIQTSSYMKLMSFPPGTFQVKLPKGT